MVIIILAAGTRGDSRPYIALGLGLKKWAIMSLLQHLKTMRPLLKVLACNFYGIKGDIL